MAATVGEMTRTLGKLVWTTSDKGAKYLYSRYNGTPFFEKAMREYIYLKVYYAYLICRAAAPSANDLGQANYIFSSMLKDLDNSFKNLPSYCTYGCNMAELKKRLAFYRESSDEVDISEIIHYYRTPVEVYKKITIEDLLDHSYSDNKSRDFISFVEGEERVALTALYMYGTYKDNIVSINNVYNDYEKFGIKMLEKTFKESFCNIADGMIRKQRGSGCLAVVAVVATIFVFVAAFI